MHGALFRQCGRGGGDPQPKVRELDVALVVEQQIVGLDVTVDEPELVDRVDRHDGLANVEPRCKADGAGVGWGV